MIIFEVVWLYTKLLNIPERDYSHLLGSHSQNMGHTDTALAEEKEKYFFQQHIYLLLELASKGELSQLFIRSFLCLN